MNQGRNSPYSQRRSQHRSQVSVDSADQGAGGYRLAGSLRGSDNSGGSALQNSQNSGTFREFQQQLQLQQQIRHNDGVTNSNIASFAPKRNNRRQPQHQRSHRSSMSSSSSSRGTDKLNQSLSDIHRSLRDPPEINRQRRGHGGAYNSSFTTSRTRRPNRVQNMQSQSLIPTQRQNVQPQSLGINRLTRSLEPKKEEEEEDDEFDTIPLVSNEYLKELNSRRATTHTIGSDDSKANRMNPNNNNKRDVGNSVQDSKFSSLSQSIRVAARRPNNVNNEMQHIHRASQDSSDSRQSFSSNQNRQQHHQASIVRDSFNSNQSSQYRPARLGLSRGVRQQRRQQTNQYSASLNETQLRRNSRSDLGSSSPLFHSQRRRSTVDDGGRVNYDNSAQLRHSVGVVGYNNQIIPSEQQGPIVLNKNPPESMFPHAQHSTGVMNGSSDYGFGSTQNVNDAATENSTNKGSVSVVKRKKRHMFVAAGVCLIVVIVIVVVIVYITTSRSSDDDSKSKQIQTQKPLVESDVELISECADCISKPVSDIEGRCSPSNLPGSMSSCKNACSAAACCYPNFEGEKCYDDSNEASLIACGQYRPHCDVVYRPWQGASMGLIPDAPTSLFDGSDWDEICGSGASERKLLANNTSQTLTCLEFCLPSKCCFAPIVQSDRLNQGLFLNQDGAYQSIESDEYIMTSCTPKNYNSCLDYADACRDLIIPLSFWQDEGVSEISEVSSSPSISIAPSTSTRRPTLQPTTEKPTTQTPTKEVVVSSPQGQVDDTTREPTREPTPLPSAKDVISLAPITLPPVAPTIVIPIPDLAKIRESCTGFQNYNLIAKGEFNARTKCTSACSDGLCCFVDLGLGINKSCFNGNEDVCALYSDCLVLRAKPFNVLDVDSNKDGPPTPTNDITSLCSSKSIDTPVGISECFQACMPGSWCCGALGESSCFDEFEESCSAYGQCSLMIDVYGGDSNQALPPIPPIDLPYKCSYSALRAFHQSDDNVMTECNRICDAGMCCMGNTCGIGSAATEIEIADRCAAYEPCQHLLQLPFPPNDLETLCEKKESPQCLDACSIASCCWLSDDGGCFANFEQSCSSYAPYCAPNMSEIGDFPVPLSPPPSDLCVTGPPSACRNACRAGPSCCFATSIVDNCFPQNEEVSRLFLDSIVACLFAYSHYPFRTLM